MKLKGLLVGLLVLAMVGVGWGQGKITSNPLYGVRQSDGTAPTDSMVMKWQASPARVIWGAGGAGTGDVTGGAASADTEIVAYNGTGGKTIKRTFAAFSGPSTALKTFTLPDANATLIYDGKSSITLGVASTATGSIILKTISNANAFTIQPGATGAALSWTLPIAAAAGNGYLVTSTTGGVLSYTDPATWLGLHAKADTAGTADTATVANNLTGTPTVPNGTAATTQTAGDSSTKLATTAFVQANALTQYATYTATATQYDAVYITSAGAAARAKADAVGTMYAIGFATETKSAAACIIQTGGIITNGSWSWTKGLPVFVSAATAGAVTQTAPSASGNQVQKVGIAISATAIQIMIGDLGEVGNITWTGPTSAHTYTLPDAAATLLYSGGALGTPASGVLTNCTGTPLLSPKAGAMTSGTANVYPGSDGTNTGTAVHHFELTISGNSQTMTFYAPKGTPVAGDTMFVSIYTTGSSNAVDFTTSTDYRVVGVTSPTTITASKLTIVGFKYNGGLSKWIMTGVGKEL